jgi:hypothetical protein
LRQIGFQLAQSFALPRGFQIVLQSVPGGSHSAVPEIINREIISENLEELSKKCCFLHVGEYDAVE